MAIWLKKFVAVVAVLSTLSLTVSDSVSATVAIGDVVVAEAGSLKTGKLEANEMLKITWAAASQTGLVLNQVLTVDEHQFAPIYGPYGGIYYSAPIGVIAAGHHTYTIQATDSSSTGTITGSFDVTADAGPKPQIANVVVAEASVPRDGNLASNERLVITWAASSPSRIVSQTVQLDDSIFAPINGPYSGLYFSCQIGTLAAGHHTYTIQATDSSSTGTITGSFDVTADAGPKIANVVVAEASVPRDGNLASNERLVITWAASSPSRIVSQTVQLDDSIFAPINGPYSGLYFSCQIGTLAAGTHTYKIESTDSLGVTSTSDGTFTVVTPPSQSISNIVVAQATGTRTTGLQSNQSLVITWAARSPVGRIVAQTVWVDGTVMKTIYGPYGGLYYACTIGTLAAGTHTYQIESTDSLLNHVTVPGTFEVIAPP